MKQSTFWTMLLTSLFMASPVVYAADISWEKSPVSSGLSAASQEQKPYIARSLEIEQSIPPTAKTAEDLSTRSQPEVAHLLHRTQEFIEKEMPQNTADQRPRASEATMSTWPRMAARGVTALRFAGSDTLIHTEPVPEDHVDGVIYELYDEKGRLLATSADEPPHAIVTTELVF